MVLVQIRETALLGIIKPKMIFRHVRSLNGSTVTMGMSVSAQPLLPLADNQLGEFYINRSLLTFTLGLNLTTYNQIEEVLLILISVLINV